MEIRMVAARRVDWLPLFPRRAQDVLLVFVVLYSFAASFIHPDQQRQQGLEDVLTSLGTCTLRDAAILRRHR
jgi:hypothetical protein